MVKQNMLHQTESLHLRPAPVQTAHAVRLNHRQHMHTARCCQVQEPSNATHLLLLLPGPPAHSVQGPWGSWPMGSRCASHEGAQARHARQPALPLGTRLQVHGDIYSDASREDCDMAQHSNTAHTSAT